MFKCTHCKAVFVLVKKQFLKNLCTGTQCGGFQFLLILDLWGISFHAAVVFGLGKDFLFKYALGHCDLKGLKKIARMCCALCTAELQIKLNF